MLEYIKSIFRKEEPILYPEVNIVSLGCNCLPRTVLTRHKIKPRKDQGELSCPFDLAMHPPKRITYYLQNDFQDYFDDLTCKPYKKNFLDFRKRALWQKTDGVKFFHDKDCSANEKDKLVNRFKKRINNLRMIMSSPKPILFVQNIYEEEDIENLYHTLKKLRENKTFKLLILDFSNSLSIDINNVQILNITMPYKIKNNWNKKKYYNSIEGKAFEETIIKKAVEILEEIRNQNN